MRLCAAIAARWREALSGAGLRRRLPLWLALAFFFLLLYLGPLQRLSGADSGGARELTAAPVLLISGDDQQSRVLLQSLISQRRTQIELRFMSSDDEARTALTQGEAIAWLQLPPDFARHIAGGEAAEALVLQLDPTRPLEAGMVQAAVTALADLLDEVQAGLVAYRGALEAAGLSGEALEEEMVASTLQLIARLPDPANYVVLEAPGADYAEQALVGLGLLLLGLAALLSFDGALRLEASGLAARQRAAGLGPLRQLAVQLLAALPALIPLLALAAWAAQRLGRGLPQGLGFALSLGLAWLGLVLLLALLSALLRHLGLATRQRLLLGLGLVVLLLLLGGAIYPEALFPPALRSLMRHSPIGLFKRLALHALSGGRA